MIEDSQQGEPPSILEKGDGPGKRAIVVIEPAAPDERRFMEQTFKAGVGKIILMEGGPTDHTDGGFRYPSESPTAEATAVGEQPMGNLPTQQAEGGVQGIEKGTQKILWHHGKTAAIPMPKDFIVRFCDEATRRIYR
jgi:hypothetical protein